MLPFGGTLAATTENFSRYGQCLLPALQLGFPRSSLSTRAGPTAMRRAPQISLPSLLAGVVSKRVLRRTGEPLVQYLADTEDKLPRHGFWLLGSFATANWEKYRLISGAGGDR